MRDAASDLGGRAWIFASENKDRYIEFIEWKSVVSIIEQPSLALPLEQLDTAFNAEESARLAVLLKGPGLRANPEHWAERTRLMQERIAAPAH